MSQATTSIRGRSLGCAVLGMGASTERLMLRKTARPRGALTPATPRAGLCPPAPPRALAQPALSR